MAQPRVSTPDDLKCTLRQDWRFHFWYTFYQPWYWLARFVALVSYYYRCDAKTQSDKHKGD